MTLRARLVLLGASLLLAAPLALAAAPAVWAIGSGPWLIQEENGSYDVGANNLNAGTAVWEVTRPGRNMTWVALGGNQGYWEFSNGNLMASNNACSGVTIKSNPSSNGTVWIDYIPGDGHQYFISRYCQNLPVPKTYLGGHNTFHGQWDLCNQVQGGCYTKIHLAAA